MAMTPDCAPSRDDRWPLERVLFALAGSATLLSVLLVALVSPWFLLLTAFVGLNQWLYVVFGACPASLILVRVFGLRSGAYPKESRPERTRPRWGEAPSPALDTRRLRAR
jgi:hypothetical protein